MDETAAVELRPAGEHRLAAAAEPLGIFELIPPPIKPLSIRRRSQFAQLRLPLAAAFTLFIIGGTSYGYLFQKGQIKWPPVLWPETTPEMVQQQPDSPIGFGESSASPETPVLGEEALQRPASPTKPMEPSPGRRTAKTAATDAPAEDAAIVQPPKPSSQQSSPPLEVETAKQQLPRATEAPQLPTAILPGQEGSPVAPQQPEEHQPEQRQKPQEGSSRITAATPPVKPALAQPAQSLSPAPSNQTELEPSTEFHTPQEPKGASTRATAIPTPKPRARPAQYTQPLILQTTQGASTAQAPQSSASVRTKLLKTEQGQSVTPPASQLQDSPSTEASTVAEQSAPQTEPPNRRAVLSPAQADSLIAEQRIAAAVPSTTPERVARAEQMTAVEAPSLDAGSLGKQNAAQDNTGPRVLVAAENDCELLRQGFHRGTLVPSVDLEAYQRFVRCQRLKINRKQEGSARVAEQRANQQTNDGSAASGGTTGSGVSTGSGGNSSSGGKSNGRGKGKGN
jgi:hypothetical protein